MTGDDRPARAGSDPAPELADSAATARRTRLRAVRSLAATPELAYALRRVLYADRDADVRAAAAQRLGELDASEASWLVEALGDHAPHVREATLRALARRTSDDDRPPWVAAAVRVTRAMVATERMWWVRRTAVYTLAALAGTTEVATFKTALADPFWRVRHAAVKVLAALGARDLDVRDEVIAAPATPTLAFLRASWGPVAVEAPARAGTSTSRLPEALLDPDPAVVTARLATSREVPPLALVELLCDPHAPLRLLAAERLAASSDRVALAAALDWLEEPRIPHVAGVVEHLLDGLGDPATELAAEALARSHRPGAARWAIAWVVATHAETLYSAALERARDDASLRRPALRLAPIADSVAWASAALVELAVADAAAPASCEPALVDAIAIELHERRTPEAHAALLALDAAEHPAARALQIDAAARRGDPARVLAALDDAHHGPRAIATRWVTRANRDGLGPDAPAVAGALVARRADRDPAVREAALVPELAAPFVTDPDPFVARAAIEHVVMAWHDRTELPPEIAAVALAGLASADPWVRAQACRLPITGEPALAAVIAALGDCHEMVRSAALDALEHVPDRDARLAALEHSTAIAPAARRMIRAWLHGEATPATPVRVEVPAPRPLAPPARVAHRPFERAGFEVAPLAISGADHSSPRALDLAADAGVDLWFWKPSYDSLTTFLRGRRDGHVIAGSYHADARSIETDVDRALRRLGRDTLDVLLLFWSRSPARVDAEAYAAIAHLVQRGKVRALGFSTHDRGLARTAIETSPWDVVMIRHSAAHPGIETELLPVARERGTAIVTFSALCYGRMVSGPGAPSPADCYRYSLSQPGVTACISAPRRTHELVENVAALREARARPRRDRRAADPWSRRARRGPALQRAAAAAHARCRGRRARAARDRAATRRRDHRTPDPAPRRRTSRAHEPRQDAHP